MKHPVPSRAKLVYVLYLPLLALLVVMTAVHSTRGGHLVVLTLYVLAAIYAAYYRAWLAAAASVAVAVVRGFAAFGHNSGFWFDVASIVFVGLFFLMIARATQDHNEVRGARR